MPPLITLTTDFGLCDHFAGVMKGVILGIVPRAAIVDISHQVRPFEISDGAFTIAQAYRYFPKRTVHVVVVDPGVGTARRPILAEAAGQYFIAPDNGVLSMVCEREKPKVRAITAARYFLEPVSKTFHGRDVFAPAAAQLAGGLAASRLGPLIRDYLRLDFKPNRTGKRVWTGVILKADRFGNLITNFRLDEFPQLLTRPFVLLAGTRRLDRLAATYGEAPAGQPVLIPGSSGHLEISLNLGSAERFLGCAAGSPVELTIY